MVMASAQTAAKRRALGSLWRRMPMSLRIGAIILLLHFVVAATGPFWAPYGPSQIGTGPPLSGMSWAHPFGVDQLGRDVFSRAVHGSHIVILLSLSGTFLGSSLARSSGSCRAMCAAGSTRSCSASSRRSSAFRSWCWR